MAAPFVAGVMASLYSLDSTLTAETVKQRMIDASLKDAVTSPGEGSPNALLHLDCDDESLGTPPVPPPTAPTTQPLAYELVRSGTCETVGTAGRCATITDYLGCRAATYELTPHSSVYNESSVFFPRGCYQYENSPGFPSSSVYLNAEVEGADCTEHPCLCACKDQ